MIPSPHVPKPTNDTPPLRLVTDASSRLAMSREEKRTLFRRLVVGELEAGFLRYSRRQALLLAARQLQIPEFEACLLIAEAQFHSDGLDPMTLEQADWIEPTETRTHWSVGQKLSLALATAVLLDLLLVLWLFI